MKRRNFVKSSLLTYMYLAFPLFAKVKNKKKTFVLLELNGGCDYLNTIVPYTEKNYYKLREDIFLKQNERKPLNEKIALNENLSFLHKSYKNKEVAVLNGLGYDNANLSHFRSLEIVETASDANEYLDEGWLNEITKNETLSFIKPAHALLIGKRNKTHLFSKNANILQLKNIKDFLKKSKKLDTSLNNEQNNESLDFLFKEEQNIKRANKSLNKYLKKEQNENENLDTQIKKDFNEALKIIDSDLELSIIKISQKSYDTHANQKETLNTLLKDLDQALEFFVKKLKKKNLYNDVLIMTYSEFGRRVKQNASLGTDHGTASFSFLLGGAIKGGVYGEYPSLDVLDKNNLIYTTHYRSLYNTVLNKWLFNINNKFNTYDILNFL